MRKTLLRSGLPTWPPPRLTALVKLQAGTHAAAAAGSAPSAAPSTTASATRSTSARNRDARQEDRRDEAMTSRSADVISDGSVLPSAWNMLDDTNVMPDAHEVQHHDVQVIDADRDHFRIELKSRISGVRREVDRRSRSRASGRRHRRGLERRAHAIALARGEVLAGDRRDGEAQAPRRAGTPTAQCASRSRTRPAPPRRTAC